jgi:hypothetical protein
MAYHLNIIADTFLVSRGLVHAQKQKLVYARDVCGIEMSPLVVIPINLIQN